MTTKTITFDETQWVLVPREPTEEMLKDAAIMFYASPTVSFAGRMPEVYSAMLKAAPTHETRHTPDEGMVLKALDDAIGALNHATIFISSREIMHPCGRELHDNAIKQCVAAIAAITKSGK